ncbi:Lrp/AsnC ligand binding domain-containing protein [Limibacter armeniacum]|uniref:Lrp/AsnC family transcriptional regulator n=1 Tax=Limibacter armeniacum TaxID=466084 RepID=UPI002FE519AB
MEYHIDYTDRQIIAELHRNARKSYLQIAKDLKISNSLVHQRINKLREAGVISDPSIRLDPKKLGMECCAFVNITVESGRKVNDVVKKLKAIDEVVECHFMSGQFTLLVKIFAKDSDNLSDILLDQISIIEGVAATETNIAFRTAIDRGVAIGE